MQLEARHLEARGGLSADICIVGAGPAGLTLATTLAATGKSIIMVESGSWSTPEQLQRLNRGPTIGVPYTGLEGTRYRGIGGTAQRWNTIVGGATGAKLVPLDPVDLERAEWPFEFAELEPWYQAAHRLCGLGAGSYEGAAWAGQGDLLLHLPSEDVTTRVYRFGRAEVFTRDLPQRLALMPNVILCHLGTVGKLHLDSPRRKVTSLEVHAWPAGHARIEAETFILAAGAVENARLLLSSSEKGCCPGDDSGWLGRCFMEHPRDRSLSVTLHRGPTRGTRFGFYDFHEAKDGSLVSGRLAITAEAVRRRALPNASATLFPVRSGLLGRLVSARRGPAGLGWSRGSRTGPVATWSVLLNFEQFPHPQNRIALIGERDAFGQPRVALHLGWGRDDQEALDRLRRTVAEALAPLGDVTARTDAGPDFNAHHHAGTTRMHRDPALGVVDPDGRVHGMDNLFLAGSSVLPSAGFANPVLTLVALCLRLANHLGGQRGL